MGQPQSDDVFLYAIPEHPTWMIGVEVSDDGKYCLISIEEGCDPLNRLYYVDLTRIQGKMANFAKQVSVTITSTLPSR